MGETARSVFRLAHEGQMAMTYLEKARAAHDDPELLENLFRAARRENEADQFAADLLMCFQESPENLLYAAWFYRLQAAQEEREAGRAINWKAAVLLSIGMGLLFWVFSGPEFMFPDNAPYLGLIWAPLAGCFVIAFVTFSASKHYRRSVWIVGGVIAAMIYVILFVRTPNRIRYRDLMLLHLPLLAWIAVGAAILGAWSGHRNRFAFLAKSIEVLVTGGIYLIAGGIFLAITFAMFDTLGITIPDNVSRLLVFGGAGLIPVLAVASVYDPRVPPRDQSFEQGVGRLISTLMWILLPLTLLVLVAYLVFIPFNFMEPFRQREVLLVYNAMLFAIMGLLIGATPVRESDLPARHASTLRRAVLAVILLTTVISLYALSATVYRTVSDDLGLTMNRLTIIGWNSINIAILSLAIYRMLKGNLEGWISALQSTLSQGTIAYAAWTLFLILAIPHLFMG
jgi:hypothetical protein